MFYTIKSTCVLDLKRLFAKNGRKKSQECGVPSSITRNLMFISRCCRQLKQKITLESDFILVVCRSACNLNFAFDQNLGFASAAVGEK